MPKFLHWSDLHLEFRPFDDIPSRSELPSDLSGILVAGDTDLKLRHIDFYETLYDRIGVPVIATTGNHEYYGSKYWKHRRQELERLDGLRAHGKRVHVLHGDSVIVDGVRVIGATLWSNFRLYPEHACMAANQARSMMNDYKKITWDRGGYRKLHPKDTIGLSTEERSRIISIARTEFDGPTVVLTHHAPVRDVIPDEFEQSTITAAYVNDFFSEISDLKLSAWIHGHFHEAEDVDLPGDHGVIRVRSNSRGYPGEKTAFDPMKTIDV